MGVDRNVAGEGVAAARSTSADPTRSVRLRLALLVATALVAVPSLSLTAAKAQSMGGSGSEPGNGGANGRGFGTAGDNGADAGLLVGTGGGGGGAGAAGGNGGSNAMSGGSAGANGSFGTPLPVSPSTTPGAGGAGGNGVDGGTPNGGGGGGGGGNGVLTSGGDGIAGSTTTATTGGTGGRGGDGNGGGGHGGGGGSGGFGFAATTTFSLTYGAVGLTPVLKGGTGGAGGGSQNGSGNSNGGDGGGGAYFGAVNSGFTVVAGATVQGGIGGSGGMGGGTGNVLGGGSGGGTFGLGGRGGAGGDGVVMIQGGTITNGGTIAGGSGGIAGTGGTGGMGGAGIFGQNLIITNTGAITGGTGGAQMGGGTTAGTAGNALTLIGGTNSLTLSNGATGTITGDIAVGGSLSIDPGTAASVTLSNTIKNSVYFTGYTSSLSTHTANYTTVPGSLVKTGAGTLVLTGTNTYSNGTTFQQGALNVGSLGAIGTTGSLSFSGGTLQYSTANQTDYSNRFSTAPNQAYRVDTNTQDITFVTALTSQGGSLTKLGAGTLTLTGANTYTGGTTITAGILQIGDNATSGALLGNVVNNGSLWFSPAIGASQTFSGSISGTGNVQVFGGDNPPGATVVLTGTNSYQGGTLILSKGILSVANDGNLGASSGTVSFYDATLKVADGFTSARNLRIGLGGAVEVDTGTATLTGPITITMTGQGGSLEKLGAGTLVVSGPNTASGFTVTGGTLKLGAANVLGTSSAVRMTGGTFDLNGNSVTIDNFYGSGGLLTNSNPTAATLTSNATFNAGSGLTYPGNIQDGVGKVGFGLVGGQLFLGGNDTYSGATTTSGTAVLSASSTTAFSPNSAFTLLDNSALNLNGFSNTIGSLAGAGIVSNESRDGTAATLSVGNNNSSTTFSGTIQDGSTGAPTALTKVGVGTLTLSGSNAYTGATNITAGTLLAGAANTFSAPSATSIATGGTLDLGGFAQTINMVALKGGILRNGALAGAVTSTGGTIETLGGSASVTTTAGLTTALGANTYVGGTTISGGTLQLGNGGATGSVVGNVTDNGTLAFNRSNAIIFGGVIAGTGTVQQNGTGTTILTAANTYIGATTINAGTLEVDGSIASPNVVVNDGGVLSGVGTIGDPTIAAGGTLAPGNAANPTGTLTIVGPLGFAAGSFYNVNVTPTANSRTNVVGTTTIAGGTVQVMAGSGTYAANQRYTILTSTGGITGTFAKTTTNTNFAFLAPTLSYDAKTIYVTVLPSTPIVVTDPVTGASTPVPDYRTAAATPNQLAVASGLTKAGKLLPGGAGGKVITALNQLTVAQARAAFDGLSGEGITAAQNIAHRSAELFTATIFDQTTFYGAGTANSITLTAPIHELADLPNRAVAPPLPIVPQRTWRAWGTGYGGTEDIHGNGALGSASQADNIYGGSLGVDYQVTPDYLVGIAVGGSDGSFSVPGRATSGETTGGHFAFYDLATFGRFYGASSTSFSYFTNRATRVAGGFGGLTGETDRGSFDSHEFRSRLEFGRHFDNFGGTLTPFIALELADLRSNRFNEAAVSGPGLLALNVSGQSAASVPSFIGARFQGVTRLGAMTFSPTLQVAYVHEFAPQRSQFGALVNLPGSTFLVDGARPSRDAAKIKAGGELAISHNSVIFANFDGEFSGANQLYTGKGGFRWMW